MITSLIEQIAFMDVPSENSTQFCPSEHGGIAICMVAGNSRKSKDFNLKKVPFNQN